MRLLRRFLGRRGTNAGHLIPPPLPPRDETPPVRESPEPGRRAVIAEVAVLDIVAFLATVGAVVKLIVDDAANPWWWLGVGLAAALTVISAVRLIPMVSRYRATRARGDTP
jgi:membrane protein YdbS with pleckstrin-like domain